MRRKKWAEGEAEEVVGREAVEEEVAEGKEEVSRGRSIRRRMKS